MDRTHRIPRRTPPAVLLPSALLPAVLLPAVLLLAGPAAGAPGPAAPVYPFWSLPGDSVAADTRLTLGAGILDSQGSAARLADDEGLVDEFRPLALWSHRGAAGDAGLFETRGLVVGDDRTTARVTARLNVPGGRDLRLRYVRSLHYDDPMWIHTRPQEPERVKVRFDYVITQAESGEVVCTGFTGHCALNLEGKPVQVDEQTIGIIRSFPE